MPNQIMVTQYDSKDSLLGNEKRLISHEDIRLLFDIGGPFDNDSLEILYISPVGGPESA